jgi:YD repeat-containing protein
VIRKDLFDVNGALLTTTTASYNAFHLLSETDEEGITTFHSYDPAGRLVHSQKEDKVTEYAYDSLGRKYKTIEWIDPHNARITINLYDLLDRVIEERVEDLSGTVFLKKQYAYDLAGNRTHAVHWTDEGPAVTYTEYASDGMPSLIQDPLGNLTYFAYDYDARHYGAGCLKTIQVDSLGNQHVEVKDYRGKIACRMRLNSLGEVIQKQDDFYDPLNRLTSSHAVVYSGTHAGKTQITEWKYDSMGNLVQLTEAAGTSEEKTTAFSYNTNGQKERTILPNSTHIEHGYDALGRLTLYKSSDGTIHYTYSYDQKSRPLSVWDHVHGTANHRSYNTWGDMISETLDNGIVIHYDYDLLGRQVQLAFNDGTAVRYNYDACHLTDVERVKNGSAVYTHRYLSHDLSGHPIREALIGENGLLERAYDPLKRPL